jgi:hypothetical protein
MAQMTGKDRWGLGKAAASGWGDDYAQSMGAALACYTMPYVRRRTDPRNQ